MPKGAVLRLIYLIMTVPFYIAALLLYFFNVFKCKDKLRKCFLVIDQECEKIPDSYVGYLVAAEDHRSRFHYGIDQIGIIRALFKRILHGKVEGASTIEQQFVRVVLGDYRFSYRRKIKEQLLAVLLLKKRKKFDIARSYLAIAYYGHDCVGVPGVSKIIGNDLRAASKNQIISLMARLKYPKPLGKEDVWEEKFSKRVLYLTERCEHSTKKTEGLLLQALK